jgi:anti-sigma regulatory factor (Ser/Thr protein kinase)
MLLGPEDVVWCRLEDDSAIGTVRRSIAAVARRLGFADGRIAEMAIAATELTTNAVLHASGASALVRIRRAGERSAVELIVVDAGPGIADVPNALVDGESSRGTFGVGLGAVGRLANHFETYSNRPAGTVMWASFLPDLGAAALPARVDGLTRPITGESVCGDAWAAVESDDRVAVLVADGLGHGELAAQASRAAVAAFAVDPWRGPVATLADAHRRLAGTRGAAVLVVDVDRVGRDVRWAGVGNIAGRVVGAGHVTNLSSRPGIVGQRLPHLREERAPLDEQALVVLHSDGLTAKWALEQWRGLVLRSSTVVAAALLQWAGLRHDDATVVVTRVP